MAYLNELVKDCLQLEQAFCSAKCPFNLDVRDFIGKLQQGRYNVAYKTYQNTVGFPGIVSVLCNEPCKDVCPLHDNGGSISIKLLEAASMNYARNKEPEQYNMPPKAKRIAIIGGGISGLACALRLTTKKYNVTIFEKSDRIGGHLYNLISPEVFLDDINLQFSHEEYTLHLNTEVLDINTLDFDTIYIATGRNGNDFGLSLSNEGPYSTNRSGVFMGGSLNGADTMQAIAQGLNVCSAIEGYLKTGQMNHIEALYHDTKLTPDAIRIIPGKEVEPENNKSYTKDEALAEAKRCLKCTCDACVHYSPLLNYFKKFPKRITEEVEISINPSSLDGNATLATRLISTCNQCGLCKEVCPKDIDTGEFLLRSHHEMREKGKMPWAFHEFYLRDMEFSNNEAALTKIPEGYTKSQYFFFPGCQLGASDPRLVTESYRFLIEHFPDTAIVQSCCGAPADWAGNEPIHRNVIDKIKASWINLGKPTAIFACPMCKQMFQKYLPEIKGEFIYHFIDEKKVGQNNNFRNIVSSVFDPCASRHEADLQKTVRKLATDAGFRLESLPMEGKMAECCSYGGHVSVAHPPYANHVVEKRIHQNDNPYITYCSNCRDIFSTAGKQTWHILDIVFGLQNENRAQPTVTERRDNRLLLKQQLLKEFWKEENTMVKPNEKLLISAELKDKLNKALMLETDILTVIKDCEQSGNKFFDPETGIFTGHEQIGNMTYWVEYRVKPENVFELINAYSHRMKIEEK